MSIPTTRDEFKEYCLRALGAPVLQVNVADEQVEDRVDEALYVYQQYHMDAVCKTYLQHEITASTMVFEAPPQVPFANNEALIGLTSNVKGFIDHTINNTSTYFYTTDGFHSRTDTGNLSDKMFKVGEQVQGVTSGAIATIANNGITLGDFDNGWIPIVDAIIAVTKIFAPFDSRMSADILFDPQSQFNISLLSNFTSNSIIPYVMGRQYQQLLNDTFRGRPAVRFQRHMGRLYVDVNWYTTFRPHNFMVIECFRTIDPADYPDVWSDQWLQRYTIALLKRQWGTNLSKYTGITLPGGVQLDGRTMLTEANQEVKDLQEELKSTYQLPIDFLVG